MATDPASYSDEFARTARDEAERLGLRAAELRARGERWLERAHEILGEAERLEARVRDLDELLGRAPQLRIDLQTSELQGQQLREAAARILMERGGIGAPIHYRDWYRLLTEAGVTAAGKDPLATFLTQVTRSPLVSRVEDPRGGVYILDPQGAYERARQDLAEASRIASEVRTGSSERTSESPLDAARQVELARQKLDAVVQARMHLLHGRMATIASTVRAKEEA